MHYGLVLLLIVAGLVAFGPGSILLAVSKAAVLFMLLAGLVSLVAEIWV